MTALSAERAVPAEFAGFFDEAATFPPGLAPLEKAVTDHVARWSNPLVAAVGPAVLALKDLPEAQRVAAGLEGDGRAIEAVRCTNQATEHLFGVVLCNDWSARDIQAFEYVPLGRYLGKSFAASLSLWVLPFEALDAARAAPPAREQQLVPYLDDEGKDPWGLDITMAVVVGGQTVSHPPVRTM